MAVATVPGMTVGGAALAPERTFVVEDPATGAELARAPECSPDQLDAAFDAARRAFPGWSGALEERRAGMRALADALLAARDELAALLAAETGKPIAMASREIGACDAWLRHFAAVEIPATTLQDDDGALIEVIRRPVGVIAAITPWNFPLSSAICGKIAPALRAGCTVVLKPSPFTPLATLRLGEIASEVLPAGVVNVIAGGDDVGAAMTAHPVPRKISFTGSIDAGKQVARSAGGDLKRVTLELGGNDAAVLLDDVDPAPVAAAVLKRAFFNAGQTCAVPKRVYAPAGIYDDVVEAFASAARAIVLGTDMGPITTRPQHERIAALVVDALAGGATAVCGGGPVDRPGHWFQPTILVGAREGRPIVDEEQFGPALPIMRYDRLDEAVARANATMHGLCGSVWGADVERAAAIARRLECGTAYVNSHGVHQPYVPMSGTKWSGVGVEHGVDGLLEFTERQTVWMARRSGGAWPPE
jgi:acyl-CoA reductase-like NAD-dependent aldehyde dehydrogenase